MAFICFNGKMMNDNEPVFSASNKSYRYGDGIFETMRVVNNSIPLLKYHVIRLEKSFGILQYVLPPNKSFQTIINEVLELCYKNQCSAQARVRLSFFNGEGGLYDGNDKIGYLIEAWPLHNAPFMLNENGLHIGICPLVKKVFHQFANLKSASANIYSIAAKFAHNQKWNDSLVLNHNEQICESTIANIFWVKRNTVFTPPLTEACIDGVLRSYLLNTMPGITQQPCTINDLETADEVFLTNAVKGFQWVSNFENKKYTNSTITRLHNHIISDLFK